MDSSSSPVDHPSKEPPDMPVQVASSFVASVEDKVVAVMQLSVDDEEMNAFRVLLDSGCSKTASPFQKDFVGTIVFYAEPLNFSGIGGDKDPRRRQR